MGMYDSVLVNCPNCGNANEFISRGGECLLDVYTLEDCPDDVLSNVNRHAPQKCIHCKVNYEVDIEKRKAIFSENF
jgi:predicted RNA-binding Zn-ribbon protein involved in translation (DUF1610 family)